MRPRSSYGHGIVRLSAEEERDFNRERGGGPGQCSAYTLRCSGDTRKHPCRDRIRWRAWYWYVTGMKGNTSRADRHYCDLHALRFCRAHDVFDGERGGWPDAADVSYRKATTPEGRAKAAAMAIDALIKQGRRRKATKRS